MRGDHVGTPRQPQRAVERHSCNAESGPRRGVAGAVEQVMLGKTTLREINKVTFVE